MAPTRQPTDGWALAMRWGARILALIACGLFALFAVQKGVIVLPKLEVGQLQGWPLLLMLLAALLGVIIAWRWEVAGGVIAVLGALAIILFVVLQSGTGWLLIAILFTLPLLVAGLLYLGCHPKARAGRG